MCTTIGAATAQPDVPQGESEKSVCGTRARETPDIETSSDGYAGRFAGVAGRYMLSVQERGVLSSMDAATPRRGSTVLDVGGGHMQLAEPLTRRGNRVTVFGSDPQCGGRWRTSTLHNQIQFMAGDLLSMPFADQQFEVVISVRLLSHMEDWPAMVAELCRVARDSVIIDYPTMASLNALSFFAFFLKQAIEKNTRSYRTFRTSELHQAFERNGFRVVHSQGQFVLPMVAHRLFGRFGGLRWLEAVLRRIGVTRRIGNPVLLRLDRIET